MLQHPQERPKHRHCTHNKWNKLKTFYLLLRIHNSALQYNAVISRRTFRIDSILFKKLIGFLCQEGLSPTKDFTGHT